MFGAGGFGGFGQQNQQQPQQQPQQGGGLFGGGANTGAFGQQATGGFGAPQQAAPAGGLFGQAAQPQQQQNTFAFGAATPAQNNASTSFGAPRPGGFGGFGTSGTDASAGGGFSFGAANQPKPQQPAFGATGGVFGAPKPAGGLFGAASQQQGFGAAPNTGGLFGAAQPQQQVVIPTQGSSNPPYQPFVSNEKDAAGVSITYSYETITCMPAYRNVSVEELRVQDYQQGRKSGNAGPAAGAAGFGFGANTGGFGAPSNALGASQPAGGGLFQQQQPQSNAFGTPQQTGGFFGAQQNQQQPQSGGLFGNTAGQSASGGGLFGQQQPQAGGLFGTSGTQQPGTSFGFGANNNNNSTAAPGATNSFSFGAQNQNQAQQANKPLFGGGFGAQNNAQPAQNSFSFGGNSTTQSTPQPATGAFGGSTFNFGAPASNAPKPGGLFGSQPATSAAPAFGGFGATTTGAQQNKAPFSFGGGFGTSSASAAPGAPAPAPGGGLFGAAQPTTTSQPSGGLFGQSGSANTFNFGGQQTQQNQASTGGFGGGLFGNKPATQAGSNIFGAQNGQATGTPSFGGNLFGAGAANKSTGGGLFGTNTTAQQPSGGLFGSQPGGGAGLFGSTPANSLGGSLFGTQGQAAQQSVQLSLDSNPYGTDAIFAQSGPSQGLSSQAPLPFNVAAKKKKQPPLMVPFRSSPSQASKITRLRGSTPGLSLGVTSREMTPGRESTPGASLFNSMSGTPARAGSVNLFRGVSDDAAFLSPQAFVTRPSVKRLILDDDLIGHHSSPTSRSAFGRAGSEATVESNQAHRGLFGTSRSGTVPPRVSFNPASENAAEKHRLMRANSLTDGPDPDNTFAHTAAGRKGNLFAPDVQSRPHPAEISAAPLSSANRVANLAGRDADAPRSASTLAAGTPQVPEGTYYVDPPIDDLRRRSWEDLSAVPNLVVGREGFGEVAFQEPVDLTGLPDLMDLAGGVVQIRNKEIHVYPSEDDCPPGIDGMRDDYRPCEKAPRGEGLNVPAIVSLEKCWPLDRSTNPRVPVKDPAAPRLKQHVAKLRKRSDVTFIDFEPETGTWSFRVEHFSRYGLDDEDSEADADHQPSRPDRRSAADARSSDGEEDVPPRTGETYVMPLDENSEEGSMHNSELGDPATDRHIRSTNRALQDPVPLSRSLTRSATPLVVSRPSESQQSWPASLGLQPRRVQVMQASFFGSSPNEHASAIARTPEAFKRKHPRAASIDPTAEADPVFKAPSRTSVSAVPTQPSEAAQPARKLQRQDLAHSVVKGAEGIYSDAGLALGRSFRVGWGPDGTLVHNGSLVGASVGASLMAQTRAAAAGSIDNAGSPSLSVLKVEKIKIFKDMAADHKASARRLLSALLAETEIGLDSEGIAPAAITRPSTNFSTFASLFDREDRSHEASLWRLGVALFDPISEDLRGDAPRDVKQRVSQLRRKARLSSWLAHAVAGSVESDARSHRAASRVEAEIFAFLTGHDLERACSAALDANDIHLATIVAQIGGGDAEFKADLNEQLATWRKEGADPDIPIDYRKVLELCAGNVTISKGTVATSVRDTTDHVEDIAIASGLDWKRAFGLHLWYEVATSEPLQSAFRRYELSIAGLGATAPPLPPYREKAQLGSIRLRQLVQSGGYDRDALFQLVKLHSINDFELDYALDPHGFGPDPADCRLPWHLYLLLSRVMRQRDFGDRFELGLDRDEVELALDRNVDGNSAKADLITSSYAWQLEVQGAWTWAAFVLLHLELDASRLIALKSLICRNINSCSADDELFLKARLRIPTEWIYEAKAIAARSRDDRFAEYEFLIKARMFSDAHALARDVLAPEAMIRGENDLVLALFSPLPLDQGSGSHQDSMGQLPSWRTGGQIYVDFIALSKNVPYLLSTVRTVGGQLDASSRQKLTKQIQQVNKLLELLPELFADPRANLGHAVVRNQMLASLHNLGRVLAQVLLPDTTTLAWGSTIPEVEDVQTTALDYSLLLVDASA